jgi:hypothetical protein
MKLETLEQLYNLISKYHKLKWLVTYEEEILGKKITLIYNLRNFLTNYDPQYNCYGLELQEIKMDKVITKFFDDIEEYSGTSIEDSSFVCDHAYDAEQDIIAESEFFYNLRLGKDIFAHLHKIFYVNGKLQSWKNVAKNYDPDIKTKTTSIRVSQDYNAILTKGQPVAVGCQRIPIDTIRQIVEAYDKL